MTVPPLARENPIGVLLAAAAAVAWLAVGVLLVAGASGPRATREFIRILALAAVLTLFAGGFLARTVGERWL